MVLFEVSRATGDWQVLQTLVGEQVGSYFGATLCTLDQGGVTVALLVGAPSHYDGQRGGRVHVYTWKEDALHPSGELWGASGHPLGRFGASLATLGDLDGDNLPEVAVGAPLEDEECGAVYIFSGCPGGVKPFPRQRLQGKVVALGRFFGQAVAGGLDLTGDGLVDMAVGMEGHVVVMRSRPVLRVTPHLTFEPPVIPTRWVDCSNVTASTVTFRLCLRPPGDLVTPVTFQADVDPQRAQGRGHFGEGQQSWAGEMQPGQSCQQEALRVLPCLEDFVTPIRVTVTITLPHRDPPGHILHPSSAPPTWAEIPFEQNCGADEVCEADLGVKVVPRGAAVLGVPSAELGVLLIVKNRGEDAYGVALQVNHLLGVSFRRARASQASTLVPMPIHCWDSQGFEGQPWGLTCNLSCPVLRSGWQVLVEVTFDLQQNASWGQSLGLTATVSSNNEPNITLGDNTDSWDIPVHFALDLVASWQEDSTHHLNFTPPQPHNKTVQHHYQVELLWPPPPGQPQTTGDTLCPPAPCAAPRRGHGCLPSASGTREPLCGCGAGAGRLCGSGAEQEHRPGLLHAPPAAVPLPPDPLDPGEPRKDHGQRCPAAPPPQPGTRPLPVLLRPLAHAAPAPSGGRAPTPPSAVRLLQEELPGADGAGGGAGGRRGGGRGRAAGGRGEPPKWGNPRRGRPTLLTCPFPLPAWKAFWFWAPSLPSEGVSNPSPTPIKRSKAPPPP
ncbi:integrin alpha-L-like isoform X2 [Corvus kubaryi]|uniref:integrin alpha-L-like isoform X2 n=1 Tax=Corvus kubaryi TaxID=68294 RepID=UPI001C05AE22|nr:integrin alpha-L-like isoform X2 [Corvus kubaryi]